MKSEHSRVKIFIKTSSTHECLNGVNEFVSSSDLEKFHQKCSIINGCSAVNGCRQNESPNS